MKCYVCLESCHTTSPCTCESPIHTECFSSMQRQMPRNECTVCKSPLNVEMVSFPESCEPPILIVVEDSESVYCPCLALFLTIFAYYVGSGYLGKAVLLVAGFELVGFWEFWSVPHIICVCCVTFILSLLFSKK